MYYHLKTFDVNVKLFWSMFCKMGITHQIITVHVLKNIQNLPPWAVSRCVKTIRYKCILNKHQRKIQLSQLFTTQNHVRIWFSSWTMCLHNEVSICRCNAEISRRCYSWRVLLYMPSSMNEQLGNERQSKCANAYWSSFCHYSQAVRQRSNRSINRFELFVLRSQVMTVNCS